MENEHDRILKSSIWDAWRANGATQACMFTFLNSSGMIRRVRETLERRAINPRAECSCSIKPGQCFVNEEGSRVYVYKVNNAWCEMHPRVDPDREIALRDSDAFPYDAEKAELVGISNHILPSDTVRRMDNDEGHKHPSDFRTIHRDIELAHEDEERANWQKFNAGTRVPDDVEVTEDNWHKFI